MALIRRVWGAPLLRAFGTITPPQLRPQSVRTDAAVAEVSPEVMARQIAEAVTYDEAKGLFESAQRLGQPVTIDVANAFLERMVTSTLRGRRFSYVPRHFEFVRKLRAQGLRPNLTTLTALAQLLDDPTYAASADDHADRERFRSFLAEAVDALCRDILCGLKTPSERRTQGRAVLAKCRQWLRRHTDARELRLETSAAALERLGPHLRPRAALRILKRSQTAYPLDEATRPLYTRMYIAVAHILFGARRFKSVLRLGFEMHNRGIVALPRELVYCLLHLCSVLQPTNTQLLFEWLVRTSPPADGTMYRHLVRSYSVLKEVGAVERVLTEMRERQVPPTVEVFTAIMKVYKKRCSQGDPERLLELYGLMREACPGARPATCAPYRLALWSAEQLGRDNTPGSGTYPKRGGRGPSGSGNPVDPATMRRRILQDAKADGHAMFWFLHS